jgi:hypothetical protein
MTSSVPPLNVPDESARLCSCDQRGPCATCRRTTQRYGPGGGPLCDCCPSEAKQKWTKKAP